MAQRAYFPFSLPVVGEVVPVYIPVGEETSLSLSPNGGIPRGESKIGIPLPSLIEPALCFTLFLAARIIIITMGMNMSF
jgi:hypothetical protein